MVNKSWFVAYTYPRAEKKVHARIKEHGIESYLPLRKVKRKWNDRTKSIEVPLFSSYLFVSTQEKNLLKLEEIAGLSRFISFRNKYAVVLDEEIEKIKRLTAGDRIMDVEAGELKSGRRVQVKEGALKGLEGVLLEANGKERFAVEIETLDRVIIVNIPIHLLKPL